MKIKHLVIRIEESLMIITLIYLLVVSAANALGWIVHNEHLDDYIGAVLAVLTIIFKGIVLSFGGKLYD
ncbi:hypothetical protein AGMMS49944_15900 [Spirochaetia bacterium]|nr:hypothetical protein AGMMS49944_15900 [Spirochaetia bacterium]